MGTESDWQTFLAEFNEERLASASLQERAREEIAGVSWLGFPGASEEAIAAAEARLGVRLPPSYHAFLRVSNGWRFPSAFIDRVWGVEKVAWFRERHADWIAAYEGFGEDPEHQDAVDFPEHFPSAHFAAALEISEEGDSAILLLNPQVVTPEGEWEAWFFANWLPGASRFPSFGALMEDLRRDSQRPALRRTERRKGAEAAVKKLVTRRRQNSRVLWYLLVAGVLALWVMGMRYVPSEPKDYGLVHGALASAEGHTDSLELRLQGSSIRYCVPVEVYGKSFQRRAFADQVHRGTELEITALVSEIAVPAKPLWNEPTVFIWGLRAGGRDFCVLQDHLAWESRNHEFTLLAAGLGTLLVMYLGVQLHRGKKG